LFLLATVVIRDESWLRTLDAWTDYRRWLRGNFAYRISKGTGRRTPVEVHASHFSTGAGEWYGKPYGLEARMRALRVGLRLIGRHARVFAVAWEPNRVAADADPPEGGIATHVWTVMLERLATHSNYDHGGDRVACFIDSGYGEQFARVVRRMRRYHRVGSIYGGSIPATAPMLIDDPSVRDSKQSPFVQMADMCAYAALRELRPSAATGGLWAELGQGIIRDVNKWMKGQPPGIKLLPM